MQKTRHWIAKTVAEISKNTQYILCAALIAFAVWVIYGNDFQILVNESIQNESLSHVILIPFLAGYLFYLRRDMVKASLALDKNQRQTRAKYVHELVGVILCLIAFLLYWYGSYTFYPLEYHILSFPVFLFGVTLLLLGMKPTLATSWPILFLFFLVPLPTQFMYTLGGLLANTNTLASYNVLKLLGLPVELSTTYGPPTLTLTSTAGQPASFAIDLPCSGIYSLIAFAMFAAFLALVASGTTPRKTALIATGFITFEILNIIRISTIISIAYWFGQEIAMYFFHAVAGLALIFIGMLLTLAIGEKFLKIRIAAARQEIEPCPKCSKSPTSFCTNCGKYLNIFQRRVSNRVWAKLLLLIIGCSLAIASISAPTFVLAQGPGRAASSVIWENATQVFPQIPDRRLTFLYRDTAYERTARQDASLVYSYTSPTNYSKPTIYAIIGVASSISNLHSWEVCFASMQIAQGQYPLVSVLDEKETQLLEDVPLIARFFVFRSPYNYTQVTLYWYEKAAIRTGLTIEQKYVRISLLIITDTTRYQPHEDELLTIAQSIAQFWEPLKAQSIISLGVPAQQLLLAVSIGFVAFTETAQYSNEWRKRRNNAQIFHKFAPPKEKQVLVIIQELAKKNNTMQTGRIGKALSEEIGKTVKASQLLEVLNRLEWYGFIKRDIISTGNQPKLVWKIVY